MIPTVMALFLTLAAMSPADAARGFADPEHAIHTAMNPTDAAHDFANPPESARPWVYWYFMDGNITREGLTADLEAMRRAGIGGGIFLEVDLGVPRGPVRFMSDEWQALFAHAVKEADRLGLQIALGSGPGWCGTGGPWVTPEQSMQHLVSSATAVKGPGPIRVQFPQPAPREPFFGVGTLTPELEQAWRAFYRDVVVLAFPTPAEPARIEDLDGKALFQRAPYSSQPGVPPRIGSPTENRSSEGCAPAGQVLDLTPLMKPDGTLEWDAPDGAWTVLRMGRTITGQATRPAPLPGLGFETDKFDRSALDAHFAQYVGRLLPLVGPRRPGRGLTTVHFDSWEMSSQNWSAAFREEFLRRRGYDPLRYLPTLAGFVVDSPEATERFLFDLRLVAQELVLQNHAGRLRELAIENGLQLSIEPYDMNPTSDLDLGAQADVPMCEFWADGYGFKTEYSCFEATSIAHLLGRPIVGAEAFTANPGEDWKLHPGAMKNQADWALACGINRIVFHRYQHQPWLDRRPGMRMGPYGVHWERTQTWWEMAEGFHTYLARCQAMLRRGRTVADILYLTPEGAPNVFVRPPDSTTPGLPDRRGYNFDACSPLMLAEARAENGRVAFPSGARYSVLVLPRVETMTPELLRKVVELVEGGATVIGAPPKRSPSLVGYPSIDEEVASRAKRLWSGGQVVLDRWDPAPRRHPVEGAQWIWASGDARTAAPAGTREFERGFSVSRATKAALAVHADNAFRAFLDGRLVAAGSDFRVGTPTPVRLAKGGHTIRIEVVNEGESPNPAGLIATLRGDGLDLATDRSWTTPGAVVVELGPWDASPWGLRLDPEPIYPPYTETAKLLAKRGLPPDFESSADLRYTHRTDEGVEIYFVGNRTDQTVDAVCRFRVSGLQPELWDPLTGERHGLPAAVARSGRTSVRLSFAPHQSWFVVFSSGASVGRAPGRTRPVQTLDGPWELRFDPAWGGPESATFNTLEDWTARPEPGIRHYSGIATYRLVFDAHDAKARFLSLGRVEVMAQARLNGRDLGVAWCAPWRMAIPEGSLLSKGNVLEIDVANLWINRLAFDAGLTESERLTWTTSNPYGPDTAPAPSGLLGPVRLER